MGEGVGDGLAVNGGCDEVLLPILGCEVEEVGYGVEGLGWRGISGAALFVFWSGCLLGEFQGSEGVAFYEILLDCRLAGGEAWSDQSFVFARCNLDSPPQMPINIFQCQTPSVRCKRCR